MATLHQKLAVATVLVALLGTLWSLYRVYGGAATERLAVAGWCCVLLCAADGVTGVIVGASGARPVDASHFVVGPLTLAPLPVALVASRRLEGRSAAAVIAAGWVITTALALRATGSGGLTG